MEIAKLMNSQGNISNFPIAINVNAHGGSSLSMFKLRKGYKRCRKDKASMTTVTKIETTESI